MKAAHLRPAPPRGRSVAAPGERGAALLTAMIIVTLVASLAAAMVWQQYRAVQIEAAERARAQSGWILQGALDWARLILLEDTKADRRPGSQPADHLGEVWAVPLAEARLSTFLAADRDNSVDTSGPEAFLSGNIVDLQSRYNLRQLLQGEKVPPAEQRTLERLAEAVGVAPNAVSALIQQMRAVYGTSATPGEPASGGSRGTEPTEDVVQPAHLEQLTWLGLPSDALARLKPFVVLLPRTTPVNLNTAPREVLAALFEGMDLASAECLIRNRKVRPLRSLEDAKSCLPATVTPSSERASVTSAFFEVTGRLRLDERVLEQRSLIERKGLEVNVLARERVAQIVDSQATR